MNEVERIEKIEHFCSTIKKACEELKTKQNPKRVCASWGIIIHSLDKMQKLVDEDA